MSNLPFPSIRLNLKAQIEALRGLPYGFESKSASDRIDQELLGLDAAPIEAALVAAYEANAFHFPNPGEGSDTPPIENVWWRGVGAQEIQTPYPELWEVLELTRTSAQSSWVDLGAGYGRLAVALFAWAGGENYLGFELVPERVRAGRDALRRISLDAERLGQQDLADPRWTPPPADHFFIFDFGSREVVNSVLSRLALLARSQAISVVARGRGVRHWIEREHPWLSQVVPPVHRPTFSWYRSADVFLTDPPTEEG